MATGRQVRISCLIGGLLAERGDDRPARRPRSARGSSSPGAAARARPASGGAASAAGAGRGVAGRRRRGAAARPPGGARAAGRPARRASGSAAARRRSAGRAAPAAWAAGRPGPAAGSRVDRRAGAGDRTPRSAGRAGEEGELELQPQTADAGAVRVDGDQASGDGRQPLAGGPVAGRGLRDQPGCARRRRPGRAAPAGRGRAPRADRAGRCPAAASPASSASTKPSTAAASARPSSSRTSASVTVVGRGREQLVEDRLGVAHAAGRESGDQVDGGRLDAAGRRPSRIRLSLPSISGIVSRRTS